MAQAGEFDRRYVLQDRTITRGEHANQVETWRDVASIWCRERNLWGMERRRGEQDEPFGRVVIRTRYRGHVTTAMRLRTGGTEEAPSGILLIQRVSDVRDSSTRARELELECAITDDTTRA